MLSGNSSTLVVLRKVGIAFALAGTLHAAPVVADTCGNGVLDDGEYCDFAMENGPECCNRQCRRWDYRQVQYPSAGARHFCMIEVGSTPTIDAALPESHVVCFGEDTHGKITPPRGRFVAVTAGDEFTCALTQDSAIRCWGANEFGQSDPPDGSFLAISAGGSHACGIRADQTVTCWGNPSDGRTVAPAGQFLRLSAGASHTCAIAHDWSISCWGTNEHDEAIPPKDLLFFLVSAGDGTTCALTNEGTRCWGDDSMGQATAPDETVFAMVATNGEHSCGLFSPSFTDPICWGSDEFGESTPFGPASDFVGLVLGNRFSCAQAENSGMWCWGETSGYFGPACAPILPVRGDSCEAAIALDGGLGVRERTDANQGAEPDYPGCGGGAGDLWYRFDLDQTRVVTVSVNDTDPWLRTFDSTVALLRGDGCESLEQIACEDPTGDDWRSTITRELPAGRYYVVAGGHGDEGNVPLRLEVADPVPTTTTQAPATTTTLPSPTTTEPLPADCGNGVLEGKEDCDEGPGWKYSSGDACFSTCDWVECGRPISHGTQASRINALDALFTLRTAIGVYACALSVCDADGDSSIGADDALRLLQIAIGRSKTLHCPAPA